MIEKHILVPVVLVDNKLIPIWDSNLEFVKDSYYGGYLKLKGKAPSNNIYNISEGILNLKTGEISAGIDLDYYPELEYNIGDEVLVEDNLNNMYISKIIDVVFKNHSISILKGKEIIKYYSKYYKDIEIDENSLYCHKGWKPTFILENGKKIDYTHELKRLIPTPVINQ